MGLIHYRELFLSFVNLNTQGDKDNVFRHLLMALMGENT